MMNLHCHNKWQPIAILALITVLNVSLIISFLTADSGGVSFVLSGLHISILVGLELAGVILAYLVSKRSKVIAAL